jgi:hypothetical protein
VSGPPPTEADERLSPGGKVRLLFEVLGAYGRARWLLWRRDLPGVVSAIERAAPLTRPTNDSVLRLGARLGRATTRCLALLPADSRCLVRSVVLMSLLARRGIATALVIGVKTDSEFEAHAWVERDGWPLLSAGEGAYARLVELGRQSRAVVR